VRPVTWCGARGGNYGSSRAGQTRRALCRASLALTFVVVPALVVVGSQSGASGAPVVPVHAPSWWDGPCDAVHWDAMAADAGWSGAGAHPLGASYLGVQVCGPRPAVDGAPDVTWTRPGWGELEWECVELAMRFMEQIYGVQPYSANGVDVVANYSPSDGGGLVKIANGTPGEAPQPGDIISFSDGGEGHVVVVASSDVNAYGNGSITVMSQNDTSNGWRTLEVTNWWVDGFNIFTVLGWLHDPLGRGNPAAPPTVVTGALPHAAVGLSYGTDLSAVGGSGPYTWSLASGRVPKGLSLNSATGEIHGVPTTSSSSPFTVRVTSSTGASSIHTCTVIIHSAHPPLDAADFDDDLSVG
jgi:surface antigen